MHNVMPSRLLQRDYRTKANSPAGAIADSDLMTYDAASRLLTGHSGWKRFQGSVGDQSRSRRSKPWFAPISKQEIDAIAIVENASTQLHDAKGNTTYAALDAMSLGHTFGWDFDNQLVGVDVTGDQVPDVSYEYDVLRRRVARTPALGTGQVYVYAGEQIVADYERGAVAASTPTYRYVWGSYIDEPILRQASDGETLYFHRNQQYSTTALTNASGLVVERYAYTAYGQLKVMTHTGGSKSWSDNSNRYLYTGREWDAGTQLYHFRARQYSPHLGRFVSRDTLGYVDGMSLYRAYFVPGGLDPFGLCEAKEKCGPDITIWLINELIVYHDWIEDLKPQIWKWSKAENVWGTQWIKDKSYRYAFLALVGRELKYHPKTTFSSDSCPTEKCKNTVTYRGICMHRSEVGNIAYGFIANRLNMTWLQTLGGGIVGNRGKRTDADAASVRFGWLLGRDPNLLIEGGEDLLERISSGAPAECEVCDERVDADANHVTLAPVNDGLKNVPGNELLELPEHVK